MNNIFKVVRILDEYRIIINAGTLQGVTKDDCFEIHGVVDSVFDPDTNQLLGTIDGVKAKLRPVEIYEKMSICKNKEIIANSPIVEAMQSMALNWQLALQPHYLNIPKRLNVDKSQISNPELYEPIRLGDKAVFIKSTKVTQDPSIASNEVEAEPDPIKSNQDQIAK